MIDINKDFLKCYRYYNYKHHRLSIYGKYDHVSQKLKIYILTLSSKEKDNRKVADTYLLNFLEGIATDVKPEVIAMSATDNTYKQAFFSYIKKTYWRMTEVMVNIAFSNKYIYMKTYTNNYKSVIDQKSIKLKFLNRKM